MRYHFSIVVLTISFAAIHTGCASNLPPQQGPPSVAGATQSSVHLLDSFEFVEITEKCENVPAPQGALERPTSASGCKEFPIQKSRAISPVDINSTIKVRIVRERIRTSSSGPTLPQEVRQDREDMLKTLGLLKTYLRTYADLSPQIQELYLLTHDDRGKRLPGRQEENERFQRSFSQFSNLGQQILQALRAYVASRYELPPADTNAISRWLVEHEIQANFRSPSFISFIENEVNALEQETQQNVNEILRANESRRLRLRARLIPANDPPLYFHIPGYDHIDSGNPQLVDRLSFQLDDKEKEKLKKEVDFHSKLANAINDLRAKDSKLRKAINNSFDAVFRDLEILRKELDQDLIDRLLNKLKGLEAKVEVRVKQSQAKGIASATIEKIVALNGKIKELRKQAEGLVSSFATLTDLKGAQPNSASGILVDIVSPSVPRVVATVELIVKEAVAIPQLIEEISSAVTDADLDTAFKTALTQPVLDDLKEGLNQSFRATREAIEQNREELHQLKKIIDEFRSTLSIAKIPNEVDVSEKVLSVPLDQVQDTELQIIQTPRHEKDLIEFSAQLLKDESSPPSEATKLFRVTKFGLHTNVSGNVIFVRRLSTPQGEREVNFAPAPAVSYTFRYRTREETERGKVWNIINPGFGLHTTLLNFEGGEVQVGVGATVSLFGDIIQGGYGYNLQAGSRGSYVFVGIGVFELVSAMRDTMLKRYY